MTSIADPAPRAGRPSFVRTVLLLLALGAFGGSTPAPWGWLWGVVPAGVALSLLASWRYGARGVLVPLALLAGVIALDGRASAWAWWAPAAALTGVWMGLREETGPSSGQRAWMLMPVLLLAAGLPWTEPYPGLVKGVEAEMRRGDEQLIQMGRQLGYPEAKLGMLQRAVTQQAELRRDVLPLVLPTVLFVWIAALVAAGRTLASRAAFALRWPVLTRSPLRTWRLPDGALVLVVVGLAFLVLQLKSWGPTAWTLLLNAGLGYCVQGIAVVESLLLARGVSSPIIVLTLLFVFAVAMPIVFMVATAAVGLSDVWLDYRRLEPTPDRPSE